MKTMKGDPLALPNPFDCMKVMLMLCLLPHSFQSISLLDKPQGYRIINSFLKSTQDKLFFLECNDNKKQK